MVNFPLWDIVGNKFFLDDEPTSSNVYFSLDSGMMIDEKDIREKVFAKHSQDDDTYVCYCFKVKVGDIRQASPEERQQILERIRNASAKGQCACKTRNPKGSCCIEDVKKLIDSFNQK